MFYFGEDGENGIKTVGELGENNEFEVSCMTYVIRTAWKLCLRQKKVYINLHRGI